MLVQKKSYKPTAFRMLGTGIGIGTITALYLTTPLIYLTLISQFLLLPFAYWAATRTLHSQAVLIFQTALIAFNSSICAVWTFSLTTNLLLSLMFFLIPVCAISPTFSKWRPYQILLSYTCPFFPTAWAITSLGLLFFLINLLFSPFIPLKITYLATSATFVCEGGIVRPRNGYAGFNMANFIFLRPHYPHIVTHELGHLLSAAVFGAGFHYLGALDENFIQKNPAAAYAEYIAESHATPSEAHYAIWGNRLAMPNDDML